MTMTEAMTELVESRSAGEPARRRIVVAAGARSVEVEGPDELDALAFLVTTLWSVTGEPEPRLIAGGMGFCAEMGVPAEPAGVPDDELPTHPVNPEGPRP